MKALDNLIIVVAGASQTGKTHWVKKQTQKARSFLAWDPEEQYQGQRIRTKSALIAALKNGKPGRFCFSPAGNIKENADFWAQCAFLWVRMNKNHCHIVAEETSDWTSPGKAPNGWGMLVRRGLKRGCTIYAISQRPSESDKTAIGNASIIHCHRLSRAKDRKYMADEMDISAEQMSLTGYDYIEKDMRTGKIKGTQKPRKSVT